MAGKTKSQKKKALDMRSKMYLVLALCSVMLLVSVGISLVLIGGIDLGGADAQSVSTVDSASMVVESGYNKEENTIDTQAYTSTILEQSADAGDSYVDETLFLGDSNTARMYRMFDYCSYDNAIGSVGMTAKSLVTFACVQVSTSSGYITMPQAVAKLQPRRVILTFGTNDLNPGYKAADFVKNYRTGIEAIVTAYPSVDIIVNAIPGGRVQQSARRNVPGEGLEVPEQRRGAEGFRHRLRQERLCGDERRHPSDPHGDGRAVHLHPHPQLHYRG
jgi:hypothetical protein